MDDKNLAERYTALEISIMREFADTGVFRGYEFYLPVSAAQKFIEVCRGKAVVILGIECFKKLADNMIMPLMDYILDLSDIDATDWPTKVAESYRKSQEFCSSLPQEEAILVTFSLMTHEEWQPVGHRIVLPIRRHKTR